MLQSGGGDERDTDLHLQKALALLKDDLCLIGPRQKIEVEGPPIYVMTFNCWVTKLADPFPILLFNRPEMTLKHILELRSKINFIHF